MGSIIIREINSVKKKNSIMLLTVLCSGNLISHVFIENKALEMCNSLLFNIFKFLNN